MTLHFRCLRDLSNVLKEYIDEDKIDSFIERLINVRGTNSSFKLVFKEISEYMEMKSDSKK